MTRPRIKFAATIAVFLALVAVLAFAACLKPGRAEQSDGQASATADESTGDQTEDEQMTAEDYKEQAKETLTPEQYDICFLKGTEPPGSGKYDHFYEPGTYYCVVCGQPLFKSDTKYDSHSGWPAFYDAIGTDAVTTKQDDSLGMHRTEVMCSNCGAHLGHVFNDGPAPTGQRYCINSLALEFRPDEEQADPDAAGQSEQAESGQAEAAQDQAQADAEQSDSEQK